MCLSIWNRKWKKKIIKIKFKNYRKEMVSNKKPTKQTKKTHKVKDKHDCLRDNWNFPLAIMSTPWTFQYPYVMVVCSFFFSTYLVHVIYIALYIQMDCFQHLTYDKFTCEQYKLHQFLLLLLFPLMYTTNSMPSVC